MLLVVGYARKLGYRRVLAAVPIVYASAAGTLERGADGFLCSDVLLFAMCEGVA